MPKQIIPVYEVDSENAALTLHDEKTIGAPVLINSPVLAPGNRVIALRDVRELLGNLTRRKCAYFDWRFCADPANRITLCR